jgi:hypothetical protein
MALLPEFGRRHKRTVKAMAVSETLASYWEGLGSDHGPESAVVTEVLQAMPG